MFSERGKKWPQKYLSGHNDDNDDGDGNGDFTEAEPTPQLFDRLLRCIGLSSDASSKKRIMDKALCVWGWVFDFFTIAMNLSDVVSDLLVCYYFASKNEKVWFGLSIASLVIANIVLSATFVLNSNSPLTSRLIGRSCSNKSNLYKFLVFCILFPIAQFIPVVEWAFHQVSDYYKRKEDEKKQQRNEAIERAQSLYVHNWGSSPSGGADDDLMSHSVTTSPTTSGSANKTAAGSTKTAADIANEEVGLLRGVRATTRAGNEEVEQVLHSFHALGKLDEAIMNHLLSHMYFYIETVVESIPQLVIQLLAITLMEEVNSVQVFSMAISLFSVISKGYVLAGSRALSVVVFKFMCCACDLFGLFYVFSSLTHRRAPKEVSFFGMKDGHGQPLFVTTMTMLFALKWIIFIGYAVFVAAAVALANIRKLTRGISFSDLPLCGFLFVGFFVCIVPILISIEAVKLAWFVFGVHQSEPSTYGPSCALLYHYIGGDFQSNPASGEKARLLIKAAAREEANLCHTLIRNVREQRAAEAAMAEAMAAAANAVVTANTTAAAANPTTNANGPGRAATRAAISRGARDLNEKVYTERLKFCGQVLHFVETTSEDEPSEWDEDEKNEDTQDNYHDFNLSEEGKETATAGGNKNKEHPKYNSEALHAHATGGRSRALSSHPLATLGPSDENNQLLPTQHSTASTSSNTKVASNSSTTPSFCVAPSGGIDRVPLRQCGDESRRQNGEDGQEIHAKGTKMGTIMDENSCKIETSDRTICVVGPPYTQTSFTPRHDISERMKARFMAREALKQERCLVPHLRNPKDGTRTCMTSAEQAHFRSQNGGNAGQAQQGSARAVGSTSTSFIDTYHSSLTDFVTEFVIPAGTPFERYRKAYINGSSLRRERIARRRLERCGGLYASLSSSAAAAGPNAIDVCADDDGGGGETRLGVSGAKEKSVDAVSKVELGKGTLIIIKDLERESQKVTRYPHRPAFNPELIKYIYGTNGKREEYKNFNFSKIVEAFKDVTKEIVSGKRIDIVALFIGAFLYIVGQLFSFLFPLINFVVYYESQNLLQQLCFYAYAVCLTVVLLLSHSTFQYVRFRYTFVEPLIYQITSLQTVQSIFSLMEKQHLPSTAQLVGEILAPARIPPASRVLGGELQEKEDEVDMRIVSLSAEKSKRVDKIDRRLAAKRKSMMKERARGTDVWHSALTRDAASVVFSYMSASDFDLSQVGKRQFSAIRERQKDFF